MFIFFLILLIIDGLLMGVIILLQSGKGGGLAAMGGSGGTMADQLIGGRQAATLLTKATWITGGIFLSLSLVLSVMSSRAAAPTSIFQDLAPTPSGPLSNTLPGGLPGTEPTTTGEATPPAQTTTTNQ